MPMPRYDLRSLTIILLALMALRIGALALNGTDLFFDESQYWAWSREPAFGYYSKPPLIAWLIAASTSVCGDGEFCVRVPSVLIHTATSFVIYALGRLLYSERTGFWSALAYATLPGVSFSSGIISTDVPLLFAWALALLGFARLVFPSLMRGEVPTGRTPGPEVSGASASRADDNGTSALVLGLALGIGLNAKYAMAYFVLGAAVFFWLEPAARRALGRPHLWFALALGVLLIVPNLIWNYQHSFATFAHTADNAKWEGGLFHPLKALEFLGAQFGVFGPVLFAALVAIVWRAGRGKVALDARDRLLIAFSLPVIAVIAVQAFLSRAHPNWAAVAYVPAVVLVTDHMLRSGEERWLSRSLVVNGALAVLIVLATSLAGRFALPLVGDPFARTMGNRDLAAATRGVLADARGKGAPFAGILTDDREQTASLLYYARAEPTPVYAWRAGPRPHDHFELMQPFVGGQPEPILLVTRKADPSGVTGAFREVREIAPERGAERPGERRLRFFSLSGYRKP
jgi:4-amino-4-deoxy-L-arabinose transferase-like glycosyltransferase